MLSRHNIAIFGGSFNPPHLGHLTAMIWLREALGYSNIHMVPVHCHAFNKELVDFKHRVAMCDMLAKKVKGTSVNTIEKELKHPNTTCNLINWYIDSHKPNMWDHGQYKFDLIIGSDIVPQLKDWGNWNLLKTILNKIIVLERPTYHTYDQLPEDRTGNSLVFKYLFDYYSVGITSISSSEVREKIKVGRINHLVGNDIESYIKKHGLYK